MRDRGPWGDTIERLGAADKAAFLAHLQRLDADGVLHRFNDELSGEYLASYVDHVDFNHHILLAIVEHGAVRATVELCPIPAPRAGAGPTVMAFRAAMSFEPNWRSQGMETALLLRAISAVRHAGGKTLVVDQISCVDRFRTLAGLFSAVLWFDNFGCEAWFDISPDAKVQPHLVPAIAQCL
jgi:GNAT superfamily N-acetyltransferase